MYANLKVTLPNGEEVYAYQVELFGDAVVYLDDQDGSGKYAEPAGEKRVTGAVTVEADF